MKAVIFAGGLGTRLSEETGLRPKPMIEIGGKPILWHIMKMYSHHGINDFVICLGYRGYMIKEYFSNYMMHMSDVAIDVQNNSVDFLTRSAEPWKITLVETGPHTMTGGRLKRVRRYLDADEDFCLTYGDGVSDLNITALVEYHKSHNKRATLTAVQPPERFGVLELGDDGTSVSSFQEKIQGDDVYINGGFFVLSPSVIDLVDGDEMPWEQEPLQTLAQEGELMAFKHLGYWQCMDTLRDKNKLEELWQEGSAPWKQWS